MKKRILASLMVLCLLLGLLPTAAMALDEADGQELVKISSLMPAETDGTFDNAEDKHYAVNAQHVSYTYYTDKTCHYSKKDENGNYIEGEPCWVQTVTIKGINFGELFVNATNMSADMESLKKVIINGRRTDTPTQFQDSIEVRFENCTFNQKTSHLQVYQIMPCNVTKYAFDECTFNQESGTQYAITLNASETSYKRPISYEITNSQINSKGRGINITSGTEIQSLNVASLPTIVISNNVFELPKSSSNNMAVQIAGVWDNANLTDSSEPLITVSDNTVDAYVAVRIHDSMGGNKSNSVKNLVSFSKNILLDGTSDIVIKPTLNTETNAILNSIKDSYLSAAEDFITPVTGVTLNIESLSLDEGDTYTLTATVESVDATNKDVTWTSSNSSVATVDGNGKVTAISSGTAIITATAGGETATCTVTVTAPQPQPDPQPQPEDPAPAEPDNDHTVSLPAKTPGGAVKVSPRYAEQGETVTVTPDPGYELDHLTVSQRDGRELDLTDKGNGKFTFTMPDAHVRLSAAFRLVRQGSPFVDVAESAYYADAVKWAVENGVTGGTTATAFSPSAPCTWAQIVTFLYRGLTA